MGTKLLAVAEALLARERQRLFARLFPGPVRTSLFANVLSPSGPPTERYAAPRGRAEKF